MASQKTNISIAIEHLLEEKLGEIDHLVNPSSRRYGRLLNWQNPFDPFWHYGIGLSNTHIFDTGRGLCSFEREDAKFVVEIDHIAFEPNQAIERLKYALSVFWSWEYTIPGWNCEHFARLVATDEPRCYQSQPIWFLCNLTPNGDHKTARQVFQNYLAFVAPSLNR